MHLLDTNSRFGGDTMVQNQAWGDYVPSPFISMSFQGVRRYFSYQDPEHRWFLWLVRRGKVCYAFRANWVLHQEPGTAEKAGRPSHWTGLSTPLARSHHRKVNGVLCLILNSIFLFLYLRIAQRQWILKSKNKTKKNTHRILMKHTLSSVCLFLAILSVHLPAFCCILLLSSSCLGFLPILYK